MDIKELIVLDGPIVPSEGIIYQVTLQSGAIMTRASEFEPDTQPSKQVPVVAETGQVLTSV